MTSNGTAVDPRPQLAASLDQLERELDALHPSDLDRPTPCAEFDVRTLLAHLAAVLRKLTVARRGEDMNGVADPADDVAGTEILAVQRARAEFDTAWAPASGMDDDYTVPWGSMTGRDLLDAYTHEFTVHAWDLAQAIDEDIELDPTLALAALHWYAANVPATDRSVDGPFAPAVPVPDHAPAYLRLAGFVGRRVHPSADG